MLLKLSFTLTKSAGMSLRKLLVARTVTSQPSDDPRPYNLGNNLFLKDNDAKL